MTTTILIAIAAFLVITLVLVALLLYAKAKLVASGEVTIDINNGERVITTESGSTLLSTLADNKVFLPSACGGGGSCGMCKCQVLEGGGDILPTETGFISRKLAKDHWRLGCQVKVKENLKIRVPEAVLGVKKWECTVVSNRNNSTFLKEFVVKLPEGEHLKFRSGGYIQIDIPKYDAIKFSDMDIDERYREDWDKMKMWDLVTTNPEPTFRAYSMANHPAEGNIIMLNIRIATPPFDRAAGTFMKVNPGICSSYIFSRKPGDKVTISGPYGEFFLPDDLPDTQELIFIGGGAGMAPMRSHIMHLFKTEKTKRPVSFWYGARALKEAPYLDDFHQIEKDFPNFKFHLGLDRPDPEADAAGVDYKVGFVHNVLYENYLKNHQAPEDCIYLMCGPPMMIASVVKMLDSLGVGVNFSSALIALATFGILYLLGIENWLGLSFSVITGLAAGIVIGQATEYYTSHSYKPTQKIAGSAKTGPATVIIAGVGSGMISTAIPVVTIGAAIVLAYLCATGFDIEHMMQPHNLSQGLYGIGIAAVGMLSTLGITLATDAYGPIADNAGGNAEMSGLGPEVRKRTDALDALGNTTAATGKGFAIGSAALTALALLASYVEEIRIGLLHNGVTELTLSDGTTRLVEQASMLDFMAYYNVSLMNPTVLVGVFIGAMMSFLFCGLTMNAVGRAAESMVQEVRRQFREIRGILTGEGTPDYARCVEISTRGAQREMLFPSLLAIVVPVAVGLVFGVAGVMGLLVGGLGSGFVLAVFMANAGGAWDNAKKMIEEGHFGGKGSDCHKATVVGDTVGDPFKDTSGPSLNILIKLMSMVAIVMAGLTVACHLF